TKRQQTALPSNKAQALTRDSQALNREESSQGAADSRDLPQPQRNLCPWGVILEEDPRLLLFPIPKTGSGSRPLSGTTLPALANLLWTEPPDLEVETLCSFSLDRLDPGRSRLTNAQIPDE
ncbi:hypothetical protein P7K49_021053, partial [Saguinus oedipus]